MRRAAAAAIDTRSLRPDHPRGWPARRETCVTTKLLRACSVLLLAACSEVQSQHRTTSGIRSLADMGISPAGESCLASFAGPITLLDQDYGYSTTKIATWPDQARFDARGGRWTSLMNGYDADGNRDNTAPVQLGLDWGTNIDGRGRRDLWSAKHNTPPQECPFASPAGSSSAPSRSPRPGARPSGTAAVISINGKGAVVEALRIHNHHDGFVPYRSDGFVPPDSWMSYIRDDCIENDGHAEGTVRGNLFDGCYVFYSGTSGLPNAPTGAGADGTLLIEGNLIRMRNMPGPFARRKPLGDRSVSGYGEFLKTRRRGDQVPKLVMRNNVLAFEESPEGRKLQTKFNVAHVEIVACANNTILWLGFGSFPGSLPDGWENCFTIIGGSEAQERWDSLRAQWIDAHPDIPRL
jgi:hypothetical protein